MFGDGELEVITEFCYFNEILPAASFSCAAGVCGVGSANFSLAAICCCQPEYGCAQGC